MIDDLGMAYGDYRDIVEAAPDIVARFGRDLRHVYVNPVIESITGIARERFIGRTNRELGMAPELVALWEEHLAAVFASGVPADIEYSFESPNGERWLQSRIVPRRDATGEITEAIGFTRDVTSRRELEARLAHAADHDSLTGLPNRACFEQRCRTLWDGDSTGEVAVCFVDLDGFREVNNRFGHPRGDDVLAVVAQRIAASLRPSDTVARHGGDEFAILLDGADEGAARHVAGRVLAAFTEPFLVDGERLQLSASVGVGLGKRPADSLRELLEIADRAAYDAKAAGRARMAVRPRREG